MNMKSITKRGKYRKFDKEEQDLIKVLYPEYSNADLGKYFGISRSAMASYGRRHGLQKSERLRTLVRRKAAQITNQIRWGHC